MKCRFPHLSTETKEIALNNQTHNNRTITVIKEQDNQRSVIDPFLTLQKLTVEQSTLRRGVTTLTNAISGQSQNCSGNLEISPGIGTLGNFSGKHAIIPGQCRK